MADLLPVGNYQAPIIQGRANPAARPVGQIGLEVVVARNAPAVAHPEGWSRVNGYYYLYARANLLNGRGRNPIAVFKHQDLIGLQAMYKPALGIVNIQVDFYEGKSIQVRSADGGACRLLRLNRPG